MISSHWGSLFSRQWPLPQGKALTHPLNTALQCTLGASHENFGLGVVFKLSHGHGLLDKDLKGYKLLMSSTEVLSRTQCSCANHTQTTKIKRHRSYTWGDVFKQMTSVNVSTYVRLPVPPSSRYPLQVTPKNEQLP